jgi:hypothetical protein
MASVNYIFDYGSYDANSHDLWVLPDAIDACKRRVPAQSRCGGGLALNPRRSSYLEGDRARPSAVCRRPRRAGPLEAQCGTTRDQSQG